VQLATSRDGLPSAGPRLSNSVLARREHFESSVTDAARIARKSRARCLKLLACNYYTVVMAETETVPQELRTATAIRFPQDLHDELKAAAAAYGVPLNYLIVKVMREFLEDMVPPEQLRFTRRPAVAS
jgi:hypothetical protein